MSEKLADLQSWFASILTRPLRAIGEFRLPLYDEATNSQIGQHLAPGPVLSAAQGMAIYNQQYWWRLFITLQEHYPTLVHLFGFTDFNAQIAEPYLLQYPPSDWSLIPLGWELPSWLEETYREEDRPLVLQAASLDEAYQRLFHAPTCPSIVLPLPPSQRITLQPFIALFALDADFFTFRKQLLAQEPSYWETDDFPPLTKKPCWFALFRGPRGLRHEPLSQAQYLLLHAFQTGATLSEACGLLEANNSLLEEAIAHIGAWFQRWAQLGWLTYA